MRIAQEMALLGPDYEAAAQPLEAATPRDALLSALARGVSEDARPDPAPDDPIPLALLDGFSDRSPPAGLSTMIDEGRLGEAILTAILLIEQGRTGDTGALADGLATLRAVGMEDTARRVALQLLLLERSS
jgi:hypothetical protein